MVGRGWGWAKGDGGDGGAGKERGLDEDLRGWAARGLLNLASGSFRGAATAEVRRNGPRNSATCARTVVVNERPCSALPNTPTLSTPATSLTSVPNRLGEAATNHHPIHTHWATYRTTGAPISGVQRTVIVPRRIVWAVGLAHQRLRPRSPRAARPAGWPPSPFFLLLCPAFLRVLLVGLSRARCTRPSPSDDDCVVNTQLFCGCVLYTKGCINNITRRRGIYTSEEKETATRCFRAARYRL